MQTDERKERRGAGHAWSVRLEEQEQD